MKLFCFAVDRGFWYYGQERLTDLNAQKTNWQKYAECGELDNFLKWGEKFNDL